jgi:hypothetical protein
MARAEKLEIIGKEVTMIPKQSAKKSSANTVRDFLPVTLPKPAPFRGKAMFAALKARETIRMVSNRKLPLQVLSNLLWAACGINRTKGPFGIPGRTAASASNSQEIEVYAATAEGVYLYEPASHSLLPVIARDLRAMAIGRGQGKWGANAPVRLIYVVDIDKFAKAGFQEPGLHDAEVLLLRGHGPDRGERVPFRCLARPGGVVSQLRQGRYFGSAEIAAKQAAAVRTDGRVSGDGVAEPTGFSRRLGLLSRAQHIHKTYLLALRFLCGLFLHCFFVGL